MSGVNKSKLFPCYSIPLRNFLTNMNTRYEIVGLHPETHKMFWVYIRNKELNDKLDLWGKSKPI